MSDITAANSIQLIRALASDRLSDACTSIKLVRRGGLPPFGRWAEKRRFAHALGMANFRAHCEKPASTLWTVRGADAFERHGLPTPGESDSSWLDLGGKAKTI